MHQMLLSIFSEDVTLINQLIGYARRDGRVYTLTDKCQSLYMMKEILIHLRLN
jgi:hypothetical protein